MMLQSRNLPDEPGRHVDVLRRRSLRLEHRLESLDVLFQWPALLLGKVRIPCADFAVANPPGAGLGVLGHAHSGLRVGATLALDLAAVMVNEGEVPDAATFAIGCHRVRLLLTSGVESRGRP